MKKLSIILIILSLFIIQVPLALAQEELDKNSNQESFKALVIQDNGTQILPPTEDGAEGSGSQVQKLKLRGLSGNFKNKEFETIVTESNEDLVKNNYKSGDQVIVMYSVDDQGKGLYTITDYARTNIILLLFGIFVVSLLVVGRWKGLRSLVSLALTFLIIIKYIVPQIVDGADPVVVTIIGSIGILAVIIYVTEGFNMKSHLATLSIFCTLLFTVILSWFIVGAAKLTGLSSEEAGFIVKLGGQILDLQGILTAGIIIGTLGALDDIVIAQIVTVQELNDTDTHQKKSVLVKKAMNIGVTHISAMANTLFLAYAGVSLPLLILYVSGQSSFNGWDAAFNNEMIATEIIRTLAGTIGIILCVPVSTFIAVWWFKRKK